MKNTEEYGARIERGRVVKKNGDSYRVESMTRQGVASRDMSAVQAFRPSATDDGAGNVTVRSVKTAEPETGDMVYCAIFPDGDGIIIGGL